MQRCKNNIISILEKFSNEIKELKNETYDLLDYILLCEKFIKLHDNKKVEIFEIYSKYFGKKSIYNSNILTFNKIEYCIHNKIPIKLNVNFMLVQIKKLKNYYYREEHSKTKSQNKIIISKNKSIDIFLNLTTLNILRLLIIIMNIIISIIIIKKYIKNKMAKILC